MTEKDGAQPGSRERMLEAAIVLMRGSGLSGAGINEIVRASGAPKGSVYHFFPQGKLQIIAEALAVHSERVMAFIDRALAGESQPGDKVRALFAAFARRVEEGGFARSCAVGTVSLDLDDEVQALQPLLAARFADWMTLIAGHFDFADAARRQSFAGLLLTAIEGAYVRSRAERSPLAFVQAGAWLAELAEQAGSAAAAG
jgi:TetR/AcrR family transcriptional repressor of lmrAB and yxaGH operons